MTAQPAQTQPNDSNKEDPGDEDRLEGANLGVPLTAGAAAPPVGRENVEPLLDTDDQTLEELLADLAEDEAWLDELASEKEDEHRRVTALLEELSKAPSNDDEASHARKPQENESDGDTDDDDDSERGDLTRETEDVLARALDEVELEKSRQSTAIDTGNTTPPAADQAGQEDTSAAPSSQPTRPQDLPSSGDSFALPAVPSQLQDQPDDNISETDDDFEASITSRMAALRVGSGGNAPDGPALPSAPATDVNALGLPGAPTFAPHDRPVPGLLRTRRGFTDDDEKSWCVVCLEDATVRCRGCDDDVYCARCWKEMRKYLPRFFLVRSSVVQEHVSFVEIHSRSEIVVWNPQNTARLSAERDVTNSKCCRRRPSRRVRGARPPLGEVRQAMSGW